LQDHSGSLLSEYWCLGRQLQFLPLQNLGDVKVEEVAVEDGLHAPGHDGDDVIEALRVVPEDPVENVEAPVGAEGEQVVAGDGFRLAGLANHEELGEDGHALQVDGEGPEDLHHGELVVQRQGKQGTGAQQKLNPEGVVVAVVGCLELDVHQVDGSRRGANEEDLHTRIVQGDEVREQVKIPGDEYDEEEDLRLAGDAGARPRLPDL